MPGASLVPTPSAVNRTRYNAGACQARLRSYEHDVGFMTSGFDIAVLGSGPAGLSLAASLVVRGARVVVVAPEPEARWRPNYCLWRDELPNHWLPWIERAWPSASVATALGKRSLSRTYTKLDGAALQSGLFDRLRRHGAEVRSGAATVLHHDHDCTRIEIAAQASIHARVVVDASGARSPFVKRVRQRQPALQVAWGRLVDAPGHSFDPEEAVLMDFRPAAGAGEPPTFLYALPLDDRRVFVEETSLAGRPGVAMALVRARLHDRMRDLGLAEQPVLAEEHCVIPMGLALPTGHQRVVPFGAAASMVHPASGYLVSHIVRKTEPVAEALVRHLEAPDRQDAINAAMGALWPREQRMAWELYAFGLESLIRMSTTEVTRFFDAFFRLPTAGWGGFLAGTLRPAELGSVMTRIFRSLPLGLRWRLLQSGLSGGVTPLARSMLPAGFA